MTPAILFAATLLLALLLWAEKYDSTTWKLGSKPLISALFILAASLQAWPHPSLAHWVLAGLIFSWIGDVCLIFSSRKLFLAGLVAFLLGHVCYAAGFYAHGVFNSWMVAGWVVLLVAGVVVFRWLQPHLGNMTGPVIGYIVVISVMVGGALAVYAQTQWPQNPRCMMLTGAILFYLSDIMVARDQFVVSAFVNRLIGLPLYYAAQFLFAFAIGRL